MAECHHSRSAHEVHGGPAGSLTDFTLSSRGDDRKSTSRPAVPAEDSAVSDFDNRTAEGATTSAKGSRRRRRSRTSISSQFSLCLQRVARPRLCMRMLWTLVARKGQEKGEVMRGNDSRQLRFIHHHRGPASRCDHTDHDLMRDGTVDPKQPAFPRQSKKCRKKKPRRPAVSSS